LRWDLSPFLTSEKPINLDTQHLGQTLEFVVENLTQIIFNFGYGGPIELDPFSGEFPR